MGVRILVDTNIILDYLLEREPYGELARTIIKSCQKRIITGCIAAHSITNIVNDSFTDFEDCLQMECAKYFHADYIVSRNVLDFKYSDIPCIEPEKVCGIIKQLSE